MWKSFEKTRREPFSFIKCGSKDKLLHYFRMAICNLHSRISAIAKSKKRSFFYFEIFQQCDNIISILLKAFGRIPVARVPVCLQFNRNHFIIFSEHWQYLAKTSSDGGTSAMN